MDINLLIEKIKKSSKYQKLEICEDTIRNLLETEFKKYKNTNDAVKSAKKKLHEVVAIYLGDPNYQSAIQKLTSSFNSNQIDAIKTSCSQIMLEHLSTRERSHILDQFYEKIFEITGKPSTILDLACGLNPLSFPWMQLSNSTNYYAYDIHQTRINFINDYFSLQELKSLARVQDILIDFPCETGDVAFIFKEVHRFENRKRGCTLALLDALSVHYIVISLPPKNKSGRGDLKERHRNLLYTIIKERPWQVVEIEFENEIVFCLDKCVSDYFDKAWRIPLKLAKPPERG